MTNTKGFTVHFDTGDGRSACGKTPRRFQGKPALHKNIRYVTCRACEAKHQADARTFDRLGPEEPQR